MPNPTGTNQYTKTSAGKAKGRSSKSALSKAKTMKTIHKPGGSGRKRELISGRGTTVGSGGSPQMRKHLAETKLLRRAAEKRVPFGGNQQTRLASKAHLVMRKADERDATRGFSGARRTKSTGPLGRGEFKASRAGGVTKGGGVAGRPLKKVWNRGGPSGGKWA